MIPTDDTRHVWCRVQIRGAGHVERDVVAKVLKRFRCVQHVISRSTKKMPKGYAIHDTKNWTDFKVIDFELKVRGISIVDRC